MTLTSDDLDGLIKLAARESFSTRFVLSPRALIQGQRTSKKRPHGEDSSLDKGVQYDACAFLKLLYNLQLNNAEVWQTLVPKRSIPRLIGN